MRKLRASIQCQVLVFGSEVKGAPLLCRQQTLGGWCLCWLLHLPVEAPPVAPVTPQVPCHAACRAARALALPDQARGAGAQGHGAQRKGPAGWQGWGRSRRW